MMLADGWFRGCETCRRRREISASQGHDRWGMRGKFETLLARGVEGGDFYPSLGVECSRPSERIRSDARQSSRRSESRSWRWVDIGFVKTVTGHGGTRAAVPKPLKRSDSQSRSQGCPHDNAPEVLSYVNEAGGYECVSANFSPCRTGFSLFSVCGLLLCCPRNIEGKS